jgi:hypothetical protein
MSLLTLTTDSAEAARRILLGCTNDLVPPHPEVALSPEAVAGAMKAGALVWLDLTDLAKRGVFFMRPQDGGWYVLFGFGPSTLWLRYLEDVVDTFITKGLGAVPLYYPKANALGTFGSTTLGSATTNASDPRSARGLLKETASAAKTKITAFRVTHPGLP